MNLDFDKTQRKEALEIIFEKIENSEEILSLP